MPGCQGASKPKSQKKGNLVGGFSPTPLKNMLVKMGSSSTNMGENKKYLKFHHLENHPFEKSSEKHSFQLVCLQFCIDASSSSSPSLHFLQSLDFCHHLPSKKQYGAPASTTRWAPTTYKWICRACINGLI